MRNGSSPHVRVLLVDDAPAFREVARELLELRGYVIAGEADSAMGAMQAAEELAPDAMLLDVHLPDGNGFEVAAAATRANPELAILLVSGDDLSEHCKAGPWRGFVCKSRLASVDFAQFW